MASNLSEPPNEGLYLGQWLQFIDAAGRGMAQPDAYLVGPNSVLVFEIKLTQCKSGLLQIGQLYRPLLRQIYQRPVVGILVCKNLIYSPGQWAVDGPEQLLNTTAEDIFTWHHLR